MLLQMLERWSRQARSFPVVLENLRTFTIGQASFSATHKCIEMVSVEHDIHKVQLRHHRHVALPSEYAFGPLEG